MKLIVIPYLQADPSPHHAHSKVHALDLARLAVDGRETVHCGTEVAIEGEQALHPPLSRLVHGLLTQVLELGATVTTDLVGDGGRGWRWGAVDEVR